MEATCLYNSGVTGLCHCINIEHSFKVEYAEKKVIGEHQACFVSILHKPYSRTRLKMVSFSKTATTILTV